MCATNYKALSQCVDRAEMIPLYLRTVDWALENGYPSLDILTRYFGNFEDEGLYVGRKFNGETLSSNQTYVFHHCQGEVEVRMDYEKCVIPMLYFANDCRMRIKCNQPNFRAIHVPLYIFGENDVAARSDENAVFTKYQMDLL
jgi:hypothetical protein